MALIVTIRVPMRVAILHGKYRNRISYQSSMQPLNARAMAMRRIAIDGSGTFNSGKIEVDAYISPDDRDLIEGGGTCWITPEIRRCVAYLSDNRKTLAPFFASNEPEWRDES
jgi:hypothetical protein